MLNKLLGITCLIASLSACSSCSKTDNIVVPVVTVPPVADASLEEVVDASLPAPPVSKISGSNWSLELPSPWTIAEDIQQDNLLFAFADKESAYVLAATEEPFEGSFDEFALLGLRSLRDSGLEYLDPRQVHINDTKFFLVEAEKEDVHVWIWSTVKNGNGYVVSCGGDLGAQDICSNIVATLVLQ